MKKERNLAWGRDKLRSATKLSVDAVIEVLSRDILTGIDDDKLKSAVDAKSQAVKTVENTLIFIEASGDSKDFIEEKVRDLISACWDCFDILTDTVLPKSISEDLEDNRMKNAVVAKDVARDTCAMLLDNIEGMQAMLDKGEMTFSKNKYKAKTIESIAKSLKDG